MSLKLTRRSLVAASVATTGIVSQACAQEQVSPASSAIIPEFGVLNDRFAPDNFPTNLALEVVAKTGRSFDMGEGANGRRRLVEIIGGRFQGPGLSGEVLPGGTDRQLFRKDGVRELNARYELLADDGALIFVQNRVLIDSNMPDGEPRYARSVVDLEAPKGPHDWLNRRIIVGTLHSLRPKRPFVYLRFYVLGDR